MRRASPGGTPRRTNSAVYSSTCDSKLFADLVLYAIAREKAGDAREHGTYMSHDDWNEASACKEAGDQVGGFMPFPRFLGESLSSSRGERVKLRAAIVLGLAPLRLDESLLLELQQRGIERSVVERDGAC